MNTMSNRKLQLRHKDGKILFKKLDGTINEYNIKDISIEQSDSDYLLTLPNGWKNAFDIEYYSYSIDSLIKKMETEWIGLEVCSTLDKCDEDARHQYCPDKTNEGNGYRCNACFYHRHRTYVTFAQLIETDEITDGLEILRSDPYYNDLAKDNSEELSELYNRCCSVVLSNNLSGRMGEIQYEGWELKCFEFRVLYEMVHGKDELIDIIIDNRTLRMRRQDVVAMDGNFLWGSDLELTINGYDLNALEFVSIRNKEFHLKEISITKSKIIKLLREGPIKSLSLTSHGSSWIPSVEYN